MLLYDLTSTYFECNLPEEGKRKFGSNLIWSVWDRTDDDGGSRVVSLASPGDCRVHIRKILQQSAANRDYGDKCGTSGKAVGLDRSDHGSPCRA